MPEGLLASTATEMSAPCSAQRRPAPPFALRRADPTRPLCVRVLDSTGLNWISLFRASGESFRRLVLDALEGARDACFLGEQFCWHLIVPDPAWPPRWAPRLDPTHQASYVVHCVSCVMCHASRILHLAPSFTQFATPTMHVVSCVTIEYYEWLTT